MSYEQGKENIFGQFIGDPELKNMLKDPPPRELRVGPKPEIIVHGLPSDAKERKTYPIGTGFLDYFPLAAAEVSHVSYVGNEQHNPGQELHWDRSKSKDEADALIRHFLERGKIDSDGIRHSAKMAWRAMALLEKELEEARK